MQTSTPRDSPLLGDGATSIKVINDDKSVKLAQWAVKKPTSSSKKFLFQSGKTQKFPLDIGSHISKRLMVDKKEAPATVLTVNGPIVDLHDNGAMLKDLRSEDKLRVANLIKELAKIGEEKEQYKQMLDSERNKLLHLAKNKSDLSKDRESVKLKLKLTERKLAEYHRHLVKLQKRQQLIDQSSVEGTNAYRPDIATCTHGDRNRSSLGPSLCASCIASGHRAGIVDRKSAGDSDLSGQCSNRDHDRCCEHETAVKVERPRELNSDSRDVVDPSETRQCPRNRQVVGCSKCAGSCDKNRRLSEGAGLQTVVFPRGDNDTLPCDTVSNLNFRHSNEPLRRNEDHQHTVKRDDDRGNVQKLQSHDSRYCARNHCRYGDDSSRCHTRSHEAPLIDNIDSVKPFQNQGGNLIYDSEFKVESPPPVGLSKVVSNQGPTSNRYHPSAASHCLKDAFDHLNEALQRISESTIPTNNTSQVRDDKRNTAYKLRQFCDEEPLRSDDLKISSRIDGEYSPYNSYNAGREVTPWRDAVIASPAHPNGSLRQHRDLRTYPVEPVHPAIGTDRRSMSASNYYQPNHYTQRPSGDLVEIIDYADSINELEEETLGHSMSLGVKQNVAVPPLPLFGLSSSQGDDDEEMSILQDIFYIK